MIAWNIYPALNGRMDLAVRDAIMINIALEKSRSTDDVPNVGMRKVQHRVLCSTRLNFQF